MTQKRFSHKKWYNERQLFDNDEPFAIVDVYIQADEICNKLNELNDENEQLKSQLYYNEEEGVCNICKHHYLIKDDESEFGYYNSRCKKGHYECARVSLKYCDDFELKEGDV